MKNIDESNYLQEMFVNQAKPALDRHSNSGGGGGTGGGVVEEKQIIFIDYDGTLLYSYTPEEVLALTELPPHESTDELLIFDGWNWTLEELKEEINTIGLDFMQHHKMAVGATYRTVDGATYYFVDITADSESNRNISISLELSSGTSATIDWGDGSEISTVTRTGSYIGIASASHTYTKGSYVIKIDGVDGETYMLYYQGFGTFSNYNASKSNTLKKVYIGDLFYGFHKEGFYECNNLAAISTPNRQLRFQEDGMIRRCRSLKAFIFGRGCAFTPAYTFVDCPALEIVSFPKTMTSISKTNTSTSYFLQGTDNLLRVAHIPTGTTSYGGFSSSLLKSAYIGKWEDNDNYVGLFTNAYMMKRVLIAEGVTAINQYAFNNNYSLEKINIPSTVTILKSYCFSNCGALKKIKIPKAVATIEGRAFNDCRSLAEIDMTEYDYVPTLASNNAFLNTNSALKILVPASLYDEWKAATNWSSSSVASKIVAVEV